MKATELIKKIEEAIQSSGEADCTVVLHTGTSLLGLRSVYATPLEQGEQEIYIILDTINRVTHPLPLT